MNVLNNIGLQGLKKAISLVSYKTFFSLLIFLVLASSSAWADIAQELQADIPQKAGLGEAFELQVSAPADISRVHITWLDKSFTLPMKRNEDQSSCLFFLGTDVKKQEPGKKQLTLRVSNANGKSSVLQKEVLIEDRNYPVQRLQVAESKVSLSSEALARHRKEKQAVQDALNTVSEQKMWLDEFKRPAEGELSSVYGLKRYFNGKPRAPHRGVDVRTGMAAPIRACNTGRVILCAEHFFAGKSVYIDHGWGLVSMYFHLSEISVQEGQLVQRGELIGKSGKSGRVTGAHLHFGISALGQLINPMPVLGAS